MLLKVFERIILLNILPKEGNFLTLKIIRDLKSELSFSEEEHKALQFRQENGVMLWQEEADKPKEVKIGEKAFDIIAETFKSLDKQGKLREEHLPLFERFVKE